MKYALLKGIVFSQTLFVAFALFCSVSSNLPVIGGAVFASNNRVATSELCKVVFSSEPTSIPNPLTSEQPNKTTPVTLSESRDSGLPEFAPYSTGSRVEVHLGSVAIAHGYSLGLAPPRQA